MALDALYAAEDRHLGEHIYREVLRDDETRHLFKAGRLQTATKLPPLHFAPWLSGSESRRVLERGPAGQKALPRASHPQFAVCEAGKAPKQLQVPEYAFTLNYGYHLDAGKFAELLRENATQRLSVKHLLTDMTGVKPPTPETIESLETTEGVVREIFLLTAAALPACCSGALRHSGLVTAGYPV